MNRKAKELVITTNAVVEALEKNTGLGVTPIGDELQKRIDELQKRIAERKVEVEDLLEAVTKDYETGIKQAKATVEEKVAEFESIFNAAVERAQERFAYKSKRWGIAFSFLVAMVIQLDAFGVYRSLATDDRLREQTLALSAEVLDDAENVLTSGAVPKSVLEKASLESIKAGEKSGSIAAQAIEMTLLNVKNATVGEPEEGQGAVDPLVAKLNENLNTANSGAEEVSKLSSRALDDLKSKLESRLRKTWIQELGTQYGSAYFATIKPLNDSALALKVKSWDEWTAWWTAPDSSWLGIIASWLLLSLGAPFWFNTLKSLASLRPALAGKIAQETGSGSETKKKPS